jgi:hypothetical protein
MKEIDIDNLDTKRGIATVIGTLGGIAVIAVMLGIMLYVTRDKTAGQDIATRRAKLAETQADDERAHREYSWIDPSKGTVRLPIDVAIEKYLAEQSK